MEAINVLSLFDGISCGQVALERAEIPVKNYYASEIDKYAIQITQKNYPNTIQLGDITKWQEWEIDWSSIDLLIGGSPCQGFSFAGKQLNFDDPRSKLFFVYVDILNHIKKHNPNVKFLLENVKMKKEYQNVITSYLGVEPIEINSALVSAQNRKRLYWTNIGKIEQPEDKGILLKDIVHENTIHGVLIEGYIRKLTPIECERLQTLPDNYTRHGIDNLGNLLTISNSQRYKCLGNGWTVEVIAHILRGIKEC